MVKKMTDRYDHISLKEKAMEIHRELVERHGAPPETIRDVRKHVWLASSRSAWKQFAALDLAEDADMPVEEPQ